MARAIQRPGTRLGKDGIYKAPWSWRWLGVPQLIIFLPIATAVVLQDPPTWRWALPAVAEIIMIAAMITVWRAPGKRPASIAAAIQSIAAIAALFLLAALPTPHP